MPFVGTELDEAKMYTLLSGVYHSEVESTFFARVRKLPQARTMRVGPEGHSLRKYWTPGGGKKTRYPDEAAYAKAMFELVEDAIGRRVQYFAEGKAGHGAQRRAGFLRRLGAGPPAS